MRRTDLAALSLLHEVKEGGSGTRNGVTMGWAEDVGVRLYAFYPNGHSFECSVMFIREESLI